MPCFYWKFETCPNLIPSIPRPKHQIPDCTFSILFVLPLSFSIPIRDLFSVPLFPYSYQNQIYASLSFSLLLRVSDPVWSGSNLLGQIRSGSEIKTESGWNKDIVACSNFLNKWLLEHFNAPPTSSLHLPLYVLPFLTLKIVLKGLPFFSFKKYRIFPLAVIYLAGWMAAKCWCYQDSRKRTISDPVFIWCVSWHTQTNHCQSVLQLLLWCG